MVSQLLVFQHECRTRDREGMSLTKSEAASVCNKAKAQSMAKKRVTLAISCQNRALRFAMVCTADRSAEATAPHQRTALVSAQTSAAVHGTCAQPSSGAPSWPRAALPGFVLGLPGFVLGLPARPGRARRSPTGCGAPPGAAPPSCSPINAPSSPVSAPPSLSGAAVPLLRSVPQGCSVNAAAARGSFLRSAATCDAATHSGDSLADRRARISAQHAWTDGIAI